MRWQVFCRLPAAEIVRCRIVCIEWQCTIDAATQDEWRVIYHAQVCEGLNVRQSFDWRSAAVVATRHAKAIDALCLWNSMHVRLAVPWDEEQHVVNVPLINGVVRYACKAAVIDFVYDDAFRLRGLLRSCVHRKENNPCANCRSRSKQRCLNPRYDYYLRPLQTAQFNTSLDECLSFRLASKKRTR